VLPSVCDAYAQAEMHTADADRAEANKGMEARPRPAEPGVVGHPPATKPGG
jgi:hypothetical protein